PYLRPEPLVLEPVNPQLSPPTAYDLRIGWTAVVKLHDAAPPEIVIQQAAPRKMDAFVEAVIRTHDRYDGFKLSWPPRCHLHGIVCPPGLAHQPDMSRTPGLSRNPGNDVYGIFLLLSEVLIVQDAVRLARAAQIDSENRIAVACKPRMHAFIALPHEVAFA